MLEIDMSSIIFWYSKFYLSNCFEIFMVADMKHEVAIAIFVDFSVLFY
jgi:formylmethanofuran dehydrogenase subunit C